MSVYSKKRNDGTLAWYYDFSYNKVRYRGVGGVTKTEALRTLDKVRSEAISGEFGFQAKVRNPRIEDFAETYLERRKHLRMRRRDGFLVQNLVRYFKGKALSQIRPSDIEDYIVKRRGDGVANATINRELASLKRMFNLGIKWGDAKKNPVLDVDLLEEPPGRTRFLSLEECARLINSCPEHITPIVLTALHTGMRVEEILSLRWTRVHIDNVIDPYIEIVRAKNKKPRYVPLNDDMVELLRSLRSKNSEYVFMGTRGERLYSVRNVFNKVVDSLGITDFTFHDLRHTFASYFVMRGGDLLTLKEILGHSSLKMVERYAHLAAAHKRKQINNLNGIFECHLYATSGNLLKIDKKVS